MQGVHRRVEASLAHLKSKLEARANQATELEHTLAVDSDKFTAARSRMMCV